MPAELPISDDDDRLYAREWVYWDEWEDTLTVKDVLDVVEGVFGDHPLNFLSRLQALLSTRNRALERLMREVGLTRQLVRLLQKHNSHALQVEAAKALTEIARLWGFPAIMKPQTIPAFIALLSSTHQPARAQAVRALGFSIILFREAVLEHGAVEPLIRLVGSAECSDTLEKTVGILTALFLTNSPTKLEFVVCALPTFMILLCSANLNVVSRVQGALIRVTNFSQGAMDAALQAGLVPRLVELLSQSQSSEQIRGDALLILRNVARGPEQHIQAVVGCGALPILRTILGESHDHNDLIGLACEAVALIAGGGSQEHVQCVIEAEIFEHLVSLMQAHDLTLETRHHATRAVSNATLKGSSKQLEFLVRLGCVEGLSEMFLALGSSQDVEHLLLSALQRFLKFGAAKVQQHSEQNPIAKLVAGVAPDAWKVKVSQQRGHETQQLLLSVLELCDVM